MPVVRRAGAILLVGAVLWLVVVGIWASRPLTDSVPVGIDQTALPVPRAISQDVSCRSPLEGEARSDEPLPTLRPQPTTAQQLAYQRTPCSLPHTQSRAVLVINVVFVLLAGVAGVALLTRKGDPEPAAAPAAV